ncbi:unnamed protein product [Rotaria sp. Silwood1]|nr:unnamed protein product [Rotaria sp. Silwood1]
MQTQLESLANETLLDLFEFVSPLDLFRAFYGLNYRLNTLILGHFRTYRFDFRSISREDFDVICRVYFPLIIDRIIYLRLSDDGDTPRQSFDFFVRNFNLNRFTYLQFLTFYSIDSHPKLNEFFFIEIHHLHYLTHLKFVDCRIECVNNEYSIKLINQLWSLSKLIYCYWDVMLYRSEPFAIPTIVSSSLQHLYIHHITWKFDKLVRLMEKTPYLQYFSTSAKFSYGSDVDDHADKMPPSSMNLAMKKLKLCGISSSRIMINTLYRMSNLSYLNIQTFCIYLDGHQWKEIIINYLPKLKIFRSIMSFELDHIVNKENQIDQLLDTYCTSFWIEEHQWYMGCLWNSSNDDRSICLYSLPFRFQYYSNKISQGECRTKSTYLPNIKYSYDHVRNLSYNSSLFTNTEFSNVELNHIENLGLTLPFDDRFLSVFPNFDNLLSLGLCLSDDYPFQLQLLLDKAPRLVSLEFELWSTKEMPPFNLTNASIRRLDLEGHDKLRRRHYFNHQQCIALCNSPLGIQCQVLRIKVNDLLSILVLVHTMINLRTLYVQYERDSRSHQPDLVDLLQHHVPSTAIIKRRCYGQFVIRL